MNKGKGLGRTIVELIAAAGVILSLLLVAVEIRQNTASVRAQTRQQLTDATGEFLMGLATTDLGDIWARFAAGDTLAEVEINRLLPAIIAGIRNLENVYLQYQEGVIDQSALLGYGWRGSIMYGSPAFARWWEPNVVRFHPDFVEALAEQYPLLGR